ncbi:hypothetical protein WMF20_32945 [Sorangium sp. So ce834]|uniref:hypothetical protein n=1 Tax=Sorangium sp. So ce834 TaxID=3133321 RepID=UPI003F5EE726
MTTPAQPLPLHVAYYTGPTGSPYRLLRHLAALARSASIEAGPTPARADLLWPRGAAVLPLRLSLIVTRGVAWHEPIEGLAAESDEVRGELDALRRAQVVVLPIDGRARRLALGVHRAAALRADLIAAGRQPEQVPVLFQVHRYADPNEPAAALPDIARALAWPRWDHVEAFPREKRGAREALDRAIALHEESRGASARGDAR